MSGTHQDKTTIQIVLNLFARWGLSQHEQLLVLGLDGNEENLQKELCKGLMPVKADVLKRIDILLLIHGKLLVLFSHNPEIVYSWMKRRNGLLEEHTPIEIICREGLSGIVKVDRLLSDLIYM